MPWSQYELFRYCKNLPSICQIAVGCQAPYPTSMLPEVSCMDVIQPPRTMRRRPSKKGRKESTITPASCSSNVTTLVVAHAKDGAGSENPSSENSFWRMSTRAS
mmetsp:Transcript_112706/g.224192  ORF Transcript_112706/g.224192 Transcript_112706/m.224192 type:complete len:104 (+) Transcript_112706:225-536(+)